MSDKAKAKRALAARMWRRASPEKAKAISLRWREANRRAICDRKRTKRYGISVEQYNSMLLAQGGLCAIGGHEFGDQAICVDHDHITGRVRGLLCDRHNSGIGRLGDSPSGILAALDYISRPVARGLAR